MHRRMLDLARAFTDRACAGVPVPVHAYAAKHVLVHAPVPVHVPVHVWCGVLLCAQTLCDQMCVS